MEILNKKKLKEVRNRLESEMNEINRYQHINDNEIGTSIDIYDSLRKIVGEIDDMTADDN